MARSARSGQSAAAGFIEAAGIAGIAVGLWMAASNALHQRRVGHSCPSHENAGTCVGHATSAAAMPFVIDAFAGAVLFGLIALSLVLLVRPFRRSKTS
jgi:hypothetical protein